MSACVNSVKDEIINYGEVIIDLETNQGDSDEWLVPRKEAPIR